MRKMAEKAFSSHKTFYSGILKISKIGIPSKNAKFVCEVRSKAPSNNHEN
jgi:hypothetical protein